MFQFDYMSLNEVAGMLVWFVALTGQRKQLAYVRDAAPLIAPLHSEDGRRQGII